MSFLFPLFLPQTIHGTIDAGWKHLSITDTLLVKHRLFRVGGGTTQRDKKPWGRTF